MAQSGSLNVLLFWKFHITLFVVLVVGLRAWNMLGKGSVNWATSSEPTIFLDKKNFDYLLRPFTVFHLKPK